MAARILIIEDNPATRELMTYLLGAFGYETLTASDGAEGLEVAAREVPHLILCDIQLPGMDGYEVAERIKRDPRLRAVPVVAVTASVMASDRRQITDAGFDGYIGKPIQLKEFLDTVRRVLEGNAQ